MMMMMIMMSGKNKNVMYLYYEIGKERGKLVSSSHHHAIGPQMFKVNKSSILFKDTEVVTVSVKVRNC